MDRSRLRILAFVVLALLGAPVAMHVVMHDLHGQHDEHADAYEAQSGHTDHEHPIVSPPAPQLPDVTRGAFPVRILTVTTPATRSCVASTNRNILSFGSLRMDEDVGAQPLLSTFLI